MTLPDLLASLPLAFFPLLSFFSLHDSILLGFDVVLVKLSDRGKSPGGVEIGADGLEGVESGGRTDRWSWDGKEDAVIRRSGRTGEGSGSSIVIGGVIDGRSRYCSRSRSEPSSIGIETGAEIRLAGVMMSGSEACRG
jgi:hypothetical protein